MEVDLSLPAMRKAVLITGGEIKVPEGFRPPHRLSRSTAGPGAGHPSIVLSFQGMRVKKSISREKGDFELVPRGSGYRLNWKGEEFLDEVSIEPVLYHSPEQAFFNLDQRCVFDCRFCTSGLLGKELTKELTNDRVVDLILAASEREDFKGVALTSAVAESPGKTVDRMVDIVKRVRESLPHVPVGVEPYVSTKQDIERLREVGVDEIKINVETYDREVFQKVCGKMDMDWILRAIDHACKVFGRGKVCSNIIYGMGETDRNVLQGVGDLASMGCVATLRALRLDAFNRERLEEVLGPLEPVTPERMVDLAARQRKILEGRGLSTLTFQTMCHECTCCDIVPFRDI
ncbi:MAG: radical SAM protein [Methanomassiliicoccales archaeon]